MEEEKKSNVAVFNKEYVFVSVVQIALIMLMSMTTIRDYDSRTTYVFGPIESILLHVLPFIHFIGYFCARGWKKYRGYGWAKAGMIISALFFLIFIVFGCGLFKGAKLNLFGHLYWILLIIQTIFVFILCSRMKNYKSEQEYLQKQEEIKEKYHKDS